MHSPLVARTMQEGVFGLAVSARLGRPRESIVLSGPRVSAGFLLLLKPFVSPFGGFVFGLLFGVRVKGEIV